MVTFVYSMLHEPMIKRVFMGKVQGNSKTMINI